MTPQKLSKLKQALIDIKRHPQGRRDRELVSIAKKLERTFSPESSGRHPTYVKKASDPVLNPPLSIPAHPGDMRVGTVCEIVEILLSDVDVWESYLMQQEKD